MEPGPRKSRAIANNDPRVKNNQFSFLFRQRIYPNKKENKSLSQDPISEAPFLPGSITVEAALTLPFFLLLFSLFFTFFSAQLWQLRLQRALDGVCEDVAVWSYLVDFAEDYCGKDILSLADGGLLEGALSGDGEAVVSLLKGEGDILQEIRQFLISRGTALLWQPLLKEWVVERAGRSQLEASPIRGGPAGLSLSGSTLKNRELDLVLTYQVESFISFPLKLSFPVAQRSARQLWVGTRVQKWDAEEEEEEAQEASCFVTETGSVYHKTKGCRVLDLKVQTVSFSSLPSLRNTSGGKYYACARCARGSAPPGEVIITIPGTRYHYRSDCRNLKRTIIEISVSEAETKYRPCHFCGGE